MDGQSFLLGPIEYALPTKDNLSRMVHLLIAFGIPEHLTNLYCFSFQRFALITGKILIMQRFSPLNECSENVLQHLKMSDLLIILFISVLMT